ncbi:MAG: DNA helicase RecQ [Planctomycetaceae bacterium]|nr:DNA helicase RecQ [Planctomycetaceae bacterium]
MTSSTLHQALSDIFGFSQFRPHQEEIVSALMAGQDVFAVMPTGGGKSLCYQLPACLKKGVAVIVSPLISLMKDQVDAANANGIGAASLNSSLGEKEKREIYSAVRSGDVRLLCISPERFNAPGFTDYLKTLDLSFFAVDEAHCISEWGHDFRPDYLSLAAMTRDFPGIPVAAFTATATPRVADDILRRLGLRNPHLTRASFNRPNLFYRVRLKEQVDKQIADFIRERPDEAGIVYRTTRKSVEATAAALRRLGVNAMAYHAGLTDLERKTSQEAFRHDRCQVVVATIAFGMGIDKPNVRYVIHGDLPKNLEGYYQETGRAGRDGEPAQCLLLHSGGDMAQLIHFTQAIEDPTAREAASEQLRQMAAFARSDQCRRAAILRYFGEEYPDDNCGGCDVCLGEVEREDATVAAQKALSAMVRTGERFGAAYVADILVGADTEKIRANGHDALPTYGVGKDRDKNYWKRVVEALVAKGLAVVDDSRYPTPRVGERGWKVLRGEEPFEILKMADRPSRPARRGRDRDAGDIAYDRDLFSLLRQERSAIASSKNIPPYMVFSDRSLKEMASLKPLDGNAMLAVSGVGQHKLSAYGETFLAIIRRYVGAPEPQGGPAVKKAAAPARAPAAAAGRSVSAPLPAPLPPVPRGDDVVLSGTEAATLECLQRGLGIDDAARERGVRPETIVNHLEKIIAMGERFQPSQFMEPDRLEMIAGLFQQSGGQLLRPVVESSNEAVTYLEARVARALLAQQADAP